MIAAILIVLNLISHSQTSAAADPPHPETPLTPSQTPALLLQSQMYEWFEHWMIDTYGHEGD